MANATHNRDSEYWAQRVSVDDFDQYSQRLLDGLLKVKMMSDNKTEGFKEAFKNYEFSRRGIA